MRIHSPRFHGWVMGGAEPASLGADWLVAAWDQNAAMRAVTPGVAAAEELAEEWLLDLLGLPPTASAGFVTGATAANGVGLTCARDEVLRRAGWDTAADGLAGGPRIRLLAAAERHGSVDSAARLAGLGQAELVASDDQGRLRIDALREALDAARTRRPSSACRPATCTRAPSTRSRMPPTWRTGREPGCTSTAPSGCGRRPLRACGT